MEQGKPYERLLCVVDRDREGVDRQFVVGSVMDINGTWIFYKRIIPKRDILRIRGVWGIDIRVLKVLRAEGVQEIHCYDDENRELYIATMDQFDKLGETLKLKTTQVYLPLEHWTKSRKKYRTNGLPERQVLE